MADVTVTIDGLPPNPNMGEGDDGEFDDEAYLQAEERFRNEAQRFWEAGARAENIEEALGTALTEATE